MKRCIVLFLMLTVLLLSACGSGSQIQPSSAAQSGEIPSPTATPTPDFSGTDFSGRWYVFEIIDSNGMSVSDSEKQALEAGFILELLPTGTYFVYGQDSKALGQGTYSTTLNQLTLTAKGAQTVYEIADAETLRVTQPDKSVTIMKREAVETTEDGQETENAQATDATGGEGDATASQTPDGSQNVSEDDSGF